MLDVRRWLGLLALLLVSASGFTQASDPQSESDTFRVLDPDQVRSRIQIQRNQAQARYQMQESACYTLFSVTDCIRQARVGRREVLEALRHDERALNDAERKRKALAQAQQIQERSSVQRLEELAARRLDANQAYEQRAERAQQKVVSPLSTVSVQGPVVYRAREQGRTPDAIAKDQKQYQDKLKDAQEHRASRLKTKAEKTGAPIKPLPVPPR